MTGTPTKQNPQAFASCLVRGRHRDGFIRVEEMQPGPRDGPLENARQGHPRYRTPSTLRRANFTALEMDRSWPFADPQNRCRVIATCRSPGKVSVALAAF